jgi:hypothetical protein
MLALAHEIPRAIYRGAVRDRAERPVAGARAGQGGVEWAAAGCAVAMGALGSRKHSRGAES